MGRPRLTEAEREQRRRDRNAFTFSDRAYQHYDTKNGFGKPEDWDRIAEELFGAVPDLMRQSGDKFLRALGLSALPSCLADLSRAFRAAMFKAHPDYGGTTAEARAVLEAYAVLKRRVS